MEELLRSYEDKLIITEKQREAGIKLGHNVTKLKNRIKRLKNMIENIQRNLPELNKIEDRKYYIARIKHNSANVEHAVIIYSESGEAAMQIYNHSYEDKLSYMHKEEIPYIKVIRELEEMNY